MKVFHHFARAPNFANAVCINCQFAPEKGGCLADPIASLKSISLFLKYLTLSKVSHAFKSILLWKNEFCGSTGQISVYF